jgi:hypothetical protein
VLVPAEPTADRLRELHLTLAELATPRVAPPMTPRLAPATPAPSCRA